MLYLHRSMLLVAMSVLVVNAGVIRAFSDGSDHGHLRPEDESRINLGLVTTGSPGG